MNVYTHTCALVAVVLFTADLLPNCTVPHSVRDKPNVTETEVNQAALCQSYCIEDVRNTELKCS